jgi:hypothetical protein
MAAVVAAVSAAADALREINAAMAAATPNFMTICFPPSVFRRA